MTSNDVQREMNFTAEANSQTMKSLACFQRINFRFSMCKIYTAPFQRVCFGAPKF